MRPVVRSILAILAGLLAAPVLARPLPVLASAQGTAAVPDSAGMAALREAATRAPVLLVRGEFGLREYHRPRVDSAGIGPRRPESPWRPRPALFGTADARPASPTTPWSEISSLETQRPRKLQGAVAGFVLGLALGGLLASNYHTTNSDDYTPVGLWIGTPVTGVLFGTIIGSLAGTKTIYRAQPQETH